MYTENVVIRVDITSDTMKKITRVRSSLKKLLSNNVTKEQREVTVNHTETHSAYCPVALKQIPVTREKTLMDMPGPSGIYNLPFIGMALNFKPFTNYGPYDMASVLLQFSKTYGPVMRHKIGTKHWVLLFDPEDFGEVFRAESAHPFREPLEIQKHYLNKRNRPLGLSCVNGDDWARLRKPTQKNILRPSVVARYAPLLDEVGDDLINRLKDTDHIKDVFNLMYFFAVESVGVMTFNKRLGCLNEANDYHWLRDSFKTFSTLIGEFLFMAPLYKIAKTPKYRRFEKNADVLYGLIDDEIASAKRLIESQQNEGTFDIEKAPNLLYSLLADKRMSTDSEKWRTVLLDLFTGGGDSSASVLTSSLYHLAMNPEKQESLFKEIDKKLQTGDAITEDTFKNMPYLKACIKEAMRKTFPLPFGTSRRLDRDINIRGFAIPKGTSVLICSNQVCMNPDIYPEPEMYLPERWLKGNSIRRAHPYALLPFGFGPRSCLGQRFAELELNMCVTKIVKNFRLSVEPESRNIKHVHKIFAVPQTPLRINLERRK